MNIRHKAEQGHHGTGDGQLDQSLDRWHDAAWPYIHVLAEEIRAANDLIGVKGS